MQKSYPYQELAADEIRLLRLRPAGHELAGLEGELVTCRLSLEESSRHPQPEAAEETPSAIPSVVGGEYDALSYFWGSGAPTTHITVYDQLDPIPQGHIPIKPNLEAALKNFRARLKPDELEYFWIDALCINQPNIPEKNGQIQKMSSIFQSAAKVRVWLGEATAKSDMAMDFIKNLIDLDDIDKLSSDPASDGRWDSFRDLMRRDWFNRRWIIQEIGLARAATVYCGEKNVPWEEFQYAVSLFIEKSYDVKNLLHQSNKFHHHPDHLGELETLGAKVLVETVNNLFRKSENGEVTEHLLSLEALMSTLTVFEASSAHDTVYAILWLAHDATAASNRPAASYPEVAHTPLPGSPVGLYSPGVTINVTGLSEDMFESPKSTMAPPVSDESQVPRRPSQVLPEKTRPGSNGKASNLLRPPDAGHTGRSRANSLSSLIRAEKMTGVRPKPDPILVDYNKPIYDVYKDFLEFAILRSKSLDIICKPWAPSFPGMPSWIPSLDGKSFALRPYEKVYNRVAADSLVGDPGRNERSYRASGKQKAYNTDPKKKNLIVGRALVTYGFVLDVIDRIGDEATEGSIPSSWFEIVKWEDSEKTLPDRFWRTLVADRDIGGQRQPPAHFRLACRWANRRRTKGYNLNTYRLLNEGHCSSMAIPFLRRVQAVIWDRRLVTTKGTNQEDSDETLIALVPKTARQGDLICILYGCSVPVVLRKYEEVVPSENTNKRKAAKQQPRKGTLKKPRPPMSRLNTDLQNTGSSGQTKMPGGLEVPSYRRPSVGTADTNVTTTSTTASAPTPASSIDSARSSPSSSSTTPGNQYVFIGECYVHGMMSGEAFKRREDTGHEPQYFWLV